MLLDFKKFNYTHHEKFSICLHSFTRAIVDMFSCVHILSLFNFAQKSDGRQSKSNENLDHVCSLVVWDRYVPLKHAVFHLWTHNATIISGIHIFTLALADIFQTTS